MQGKETVQGGVGDDIVAAHPDREVFTDARNGGEEVEIGDVLVLTTPNGNKVQIDIFGQRVKYETGIVYETWRNYSPELKRVL